MLRFLTGLKLRLEPISPAKINLESGTYSRKIRPQYIQKRESMLKAFDVTGRATVVAKKLRLFARLLVGCSFVRSFVRSFVCLFFSLQMALMISRTLLVFLYVACELASSCAS